MDYKKSFLKSLFLLLFSLFLLLVFESPTSLASSRVNNYILHNHLKPSQVSYNIYRRLPRIPYRHGKGHPE